MHLASGPPVPKYTCQVSDETGLATPHQARTIASEKTGDLMLMRDRVADLWVLNTRQDFGLRWREGEQLLHLEEILAVIHLVDTVG